MNLVYLCVILVVQQLRTLHHLEKNLWGSLIKVDAFELLVESLSYFCHLILFEVVYHKGHII